MAQKKSTASRSTSTAKKRPTSTARTPASTKKKAPAKSGSTSKPKSTGTARKAPVSPAGGAEARKPIRRGVGAVALLFMGVIALIALFPAEGWLVGGWRTLFHGLFGWGYYIIPAALLWGAYILGFHRGRPVQARLICTLLLPVAFGAMVHILACDRDGVFALGFGSGIKLLWLLGQDAAECCGGVLGGTVGILLKRSISVVGAFIVLLIGHVLMGLTAVDVSLPELWERFKNRPRREYDPDDYPDDAPDEDEFFSPDDYLFPLDSAARSHRQEPAPAPAPKKQKPAARAPRSADRDVWKDQLFAEMDVDPDAAVRVAKALADKQKMIDIPLEDEPASKPAPKASEKPKTLEKPALRAEKPKAPAIDMRDVEPMSLEEASDIAGVQIQSADMDGGAASPVPEKIKIDKDAEAAIVAADIAAAEEEDKAEYIFPSMDLLNKSSGETGTADDVDANEAQLDAAIRSFGVGASIVGAIRGPSITRYELKLEQGVKLSKITNLSNDIALSLGVESVRIAPIPDKISTVGVEVPNSKKNTVWLGDVIDSDTFKNAKSKLSVAMGKDIGGNVIIGNIAKMPHVLIAGTTGSGKSVCINSLILSLLYKSTPDEVRMIMIDPKMVELGIYNGMPHLYVPVVTDPKKAAGALQWSVVEMLKRYRLFSEEGVRDLAGYNAILESREKPTLPQVVIIIDELADLMMVASKEVEESICRVAQMGRAAGMHLVVATQRPSADVITGLMKANIPSRIAFAVSSSLESRIILDQQGAEKLVGAGDMLYSPIGIGKPVRVQGAFVTDEEREEIINFVKRGAEAEYSDEILAEIEKAAADKNDKGGGEDKDAAKDQNDYDEILPQAVEVIFETKQASVSMLQRRLKLGYSRAARLIDQLEEIGVVGPYEGSKPRQIMMTKQQWQEMQYSAGTAPVDTIAHEFAEVAGDDAFALPTDEDGSDDDAVAAADAPDEDEDEDMPAGDDDTPDDGADDDVPWQEDEDI